MQLEELPCELVHRIILYLPINDLKSFSRTSKRYLEITKIPTLWRNAALVAFTNTKDIFTIIKDSRFRLAQHIKINRRLDIVNESIKKALQYSTIRYLYLFTTPLNCLLEESGEEELVLIRNQFQNLFRGIHFTKLRSFIGPRNPPRYIHVPFR